jgi:hypothetical protein
MFKDIKFDLKYDINGFTRIIKVNRAEILINDLYLKQIFGVLEVHYNASLLKNPFINYESLLSYLKNFNSDVEFQFNFVRCMDKENNVIVLQL